MTREQLEEKAHLALVALADLRINIRCGDKEQIQRAAFAYNMASGDLVEALQEYDGEVEAR